jgi:alpha-ribazole phosphatase
MDIYLIRHTTPAIAKGICYGQTDLDITDSFFQEAAVIRRHLPANLSAIHSSPLQRCAKLAAHLFPSHSIRLHDELREIDCGQWEMRNWDELPAEELDPWMKDFVQVRIPDGESYIDLDERVNRCFKEIRAGAVAAPHHPGPSGGSDRPDPVALPIVLVTHGGPIRSLLASITGTPLADSFKAFSLHYGCVVKITEKEGLLSYTLLSNEAPKEKEQHKPARFYKNTNIG